MTALRSDEHASAAVAALLAPAGRAGAEGPSRRYTVLPGRERPRYVVPVAGPQARAVHLRPGVGAGAAAARLALRVALATGAGRLVGDRLDVPDGSVEAPSLRRHLATLLHRPDLDLAVALGAPRPNRKPVLQAIDRDGTTVAWVKLGVDDHTDALVAHETDALAEVAGRAPTLRTPPVLAAGTWQGHRFVALGHLPLREGTGPLALTPAVVRAIAGPTASHPVTTSPWWQTLEATPDPDGAVARHLAALRPAVEDRHWSFGRWHGDLAPWNATWEGDTLVVWDWERSAPSVPLGLDLVHNRFQVAVLGEGRPVAEALPAAAEAERATLEALGWAPDEVPLVARSYAATLRARHAADAHHGAPPARAAAVAAALDATVASTTDPGKAPR